MQVRHDNILSAAVDVPAPLRVPLLFRAADLHFAEIERQNGLGRGSISAYVNGRTYAYPRLRDAIVTGIASALDEPEDDVRAVLFPAEAA